MSSLSQRAMNDAPDVISEQNMLLEERKSVAAARERGEDGPWFGLALSGGGIRSATFCLGALQRLAKADILKHFDYQSSVSGGGYTAASLQWWWARRREFDTGANFPYGTELAASREKENAQLAFLRWHSSYLAPGGGISIWSGFAVILRTLLISAFVWLPLTIAVTYLVEWIPAHLTNGASQPGMQNEWHIESIDMNVPIFAMLALFGVVAVAALFLIASVVLMVISVLIPPETIDNKAERVRRALRCAWLGVVVGGGGALVVLTISGSYDPRGLDPFSFGIFLIATILVAFGVFAVSVAALQGFNLLEFGVNYSFRRSFDLNAAYAFAALVPLAVLASLPFAREALLGFIEDHTGKGAAAFGLVTTASGLASGLYGHFVQAQRIAPKYAARWAATLAGGVFLYAMILVSYLASHFLIDPPSTVPGWVVQRSGVLFCATLFFSVIFGWFGNLNYLGLHRFYRDRLMEAFLPSDPKQAAEAPKYSDADRVPITDFWDRAKAPISGRPYPLFNTNCILINDLNATVALRGGDSFLLSPLYVGSSTTGWVRTNTHGELHGPLTLASAMAASGAAANANAAYIGSGVTRDRLISIVMMLLNFRLGLWLGAPRSRSGNANYFSPGLKYGVLRGGYRSDSSFVELTDGGHFDNLGVYELVRRRCDLIVVLDSEEDASTSMSALASVCQRVLEDFNVNIEVGNSADAIAPEGNMGYPSGAKFTDKSFFVCRMDYGVKKMSGCEGCGTASASACTDHAPKIGYFVYIKSNMIKGLSFPAKGYKARNPDFPNQSTMDQFFEPAQFEAYRELGYSSVEVFVTGFALDNLSQAQMIAAIKEQIRSSARA